MGVSTKSIELAQQWAKNDPNPVTAKYVTDLITRALGENGDANMEASVELESLFPLGEEGEGGIPKRISFGTAGLRSSMSPGPLGMNDLTVVQTAQGLAKYCLARCNIDSSSSSGDKRLIAVVGYDHRQNPNLQISSLSFALLTALVFQEAGMDCILLDGFVLTPLVPFVVQRVGAVTGIMVTASHNPKQDDGYKVYANDACQIRAPMDEEISTEILQNLNPWTDYGRLLQERRENYPSDPCLGLSDPQMTRDMLDAYFTALTKGGSSLKTGQGTIDKKQNWIMDPPKFAYTAMHGIGHSFAKRVFQEFDLPDFLVVPLQKEPNFEFPTVPFPNPEEKGALDLAKQFSEENGCDIVLANDPDADRLAVAEKDRTTGIWTVFHGDQIGVMLGSWIWNQIGKDCGMPVSMCASTVSSSMLAEIARVEGFHFEDTLTGFKWIGSRSSELSKEHGYRHLFAYEEAIGFACGDVIFDKDGISAMAVFSEMAMAMYRDGKTLTQHMQSLYDTYGEFVSYNGYYRMDDMGVVEKIMTRIRSNKTYSIDLSPYEVNYIRDLEGEGYDSSKADTKPTLPPTEMMTFGFTNGCIVQLRPSGTEPKFKFYIEMKGQPGISRAEVLEELNTMAPYVLERLLEPEKNGLKQA